MWLAQRFDGRAVVWTVCEAVGWRPVQCGGVGSAPVLSTSLSTSSQLNSISDSEYPVL